MKVYSGSDFDMPHHSFLVLNDVRKQEFITVYLIQTLKNANLYSAFFQKISENAVYLVHSPLCKKRALNFPIECFSHDVSFLLRHHFHIFAELVFLLPLKTRLWMFLLRCLLEIWYVNAKIFRENITSFWRLNKKSPFEYSNFCPLTSVDIFWEIKKIRWI